jgi:transcriptional regulator with XRE-family HTH domain
VDIYKKLKISSGYYSNLEKGRVNPSFPLLVKFQEIFEVDDVIELFKLSKGVDIYGDKDTSRDL